MADQVQLTPEMEVALKEFATKYPDFDYRGVIGGGTGGNGAAMYANDPNGRQKFVDFMQLKQILKPALKGAHLTEGGSIEKNMAWWKQALLAAGVVLAPAAAYALMPGAAATEAMGPTMEQAGFYGKDFVGPTLEQAGKVGADVATSGGVLDKIGSFAKGKWGDILGGASEAVGAATDAAGKNRYSKDELSMQAGRDYENALMGREGAEQKERNTALDNVYRNSWYSNRQAGPNNTRGITPMSPDYMATLGNLASQGNTMLASAPQYGMTSPTIDPLKRFQPTDPSLMEKIGTYAGPIMSILGLFGGKK